MQSEELLCAILDLGKAMIVNGAEVWKVEELLNGNRIIRPSYKAVQNQREYVRMADR